MRRLRTATRRGSRRTPRPGARPTSSAPATRAWRADGGDDVGERSCAVVLDVGRDLRDAAAAASRGRSRARPAGPPAPPSRIAAAIACASSRVAGGASSTLKATSGGRAATSVAPAVGCGARRAEVGRQLAGSMRARARRAAAAQLGARAAAGERAVEEDGQRRARRRAGRRRRSASAHGGAARRRRRGGRPARRRARRRAGACPSCARQVDARDRLARALEQRLGSAPGSPASVTTRAVVVGVGVDVEQPAPPAAKASPIASIARGVAALGDVGDGEQQRHQIRRAARRRAPACRRSSSVGVEDHAVEVDRHLTVPPIAGAGAEGDVRGAEDLLVLEDVAGQRRLFVGADAELGEVACPSSPCASAVRQARRRPLVASARWPPRTVSAAARRLQAAAASSRRRRACPRRPTGAMKPSPQGRLPKAPARGEVAGVGDAVAALEVEPQVGAERAGELRLVGRRSSRSADRRAARGHRVEVDRHQPRETCPR